MQRSVVSDAVSEQDAQCPCESSERSHSELPVAHISMVSVIVFAVLPMPLYRPKPSEPNLSVKYFSRRMRHLPCTI